MNLKRLTDALKSESAKMKEDANRNESGVSRQGLGRSKISNVDIQVVISVRDAMLPPLEIAFMIVAVIAVMVHALVTTISLIIQQKEFV